MKNIRKLMNSLIIEGEVDMVSEETFVLNSGGENYFVVDLRELKEDRKPLKEGDFIRVIGEISRQGKVVYIKALFLEIINKQKIEISLN